jgi:transaldolase
MFADELRIKVFADGADIQGISDLLENPLITGFTTNPTLMRQAGVDDYETFARQVLDLVPDRPISFEVFSDDFGEMAAQARKIAAWGDNVYVKIPVTNTAGVSSADVIRRLAGDGVQVNVTALMTTQQVEWVAECLAGGPAAYVSVFAGRIADAGIDPMPIMIDSLKILAAEPQIELIWASPREIFNIVQADSIDCHIITVTHDLLKKLPNLGRDLDGYSLDTVQMFHRDAQVAGFQLDTSA